MSPTLPISSLPRYGISIRTVILKEETDHRSTEDRASFMTTSTLAIRDYARLYADTRHPAEGYARKILLCTEGTVRYDNGAEWETDNL